MSSTLDQPSRADRLAASGSLLRRWLRKDESATDSRGWTYNLALFRLIYIYYVVLPIAIGTAHWTHHAMPTLPRGVWVFISFYRYLPASIVTSSTLAYTLAVLNVVLLACGAIGLATRWTLGLAAFLSMYVFGLTECLGKVDHFQHVVWFTALLAAGPSGFFFSCDAILHSLRGAARGIVDIAPPPDAALRTLRYVWFLMGLIYVFPGLAKLSQVFAANWASAATLRRILWTKWFTLDHWTVGFQLPPRIDTLPPALLALAGWGVVAFEVSFIAWVFLRPARPFLALAGIAFHSGVREFLRISFASLLVAYCCLIDWSALLRAISRALRLTPLTVAFDGECRLYRWTLALLRSIDITDALRLAPGSSLAPGTLPGVTAGILTRNLYAVSGGDIREGYAAYVWIATRIPLLWPFVPILRFPPIAGLGERIYRWVADSRAYAVSGPAVVPSPRAPVRVRGLRTVGIALIGAELICSIVMVAADATRWELAPSNPIRRWVVSVASLVPVWPFDAYPLFARPYHYEYVVWEPRIRTADGTELPFRKRVWGAAFGSPSQMFGVNDAAVNESDPDRYLSRSLSLARTLWQRETPDFRRQAVEIRIYHVTYQLDRPEGTPIAEKLTAVFPVAELTAPTSPSPQISPGTSLP